uniref:Uncharacterized protein n=1 Tax=Megaselia scalaris TaxID=36166 RepID=T1GLJ1_MEGSC
MESPNPETKPEQKKEGFENVKRMFQTDEFGTISAELNSIYQAGLFGAFVGAVYGGILYSREGYIDFLEKNQATAFK